MDYPRFYRDWISSGLVNFSVKEGETDIFISAEKDLKDEAGRFIRSLRKEIEDYIRKNPGFKTSLKPLPPDNKAPGIIKSMLNAGRFAGVGPMASVAGAISQFAGNGLLEFTREVILENGGDIFLKRTKETKIGIFAGESPVTGKLSIRIKPESTPLGVCTSSGTVGHSLSFGIADSVTVLAKDAAVSDAAATAACNLVKSPADMEKALNFAKSIEGVTGCMVIYKEKIGSIGDIELIRGNL